MRSSSTAGALLIAVAACAPAPPYGPIEPPPSSPPSRADAPDVEQRTEPPAPALPAGELVALEVPGYDPAVVAVPASDGPKPLLIASHGAGDTPTWQCQLWQQLIGNRGFVLCPAGVPFSRTRDSGYFYRNHFELEREVLAAIAALRRAYGDRVDPGPALYTGYSQGATMGALMVIKHAAQFSRLILIEGGSREWNLAIAKKFKKNGGQRVLFACGVRHCKRGADKSAEYLNAGGVPARVEYAEGAGHIYDGPVAERVMASFAWLVEGDPRWN